MIPFTCTIDTSLRAFQYKFLMRILPTNSFLEKCNLASSSLCDFCNMHTETIKHLFWDCQHVQAFWAPFNNLIQSYFTDFRITYLSICFGVQENINNNLLINFCILLAKQFIFKSKYKNITPSFESYKKLVNKTRILEKVIACKKNKLQSHNIKWGPLNFEL